MNDKNGREIRLGDIVKISGGYFKSSNGTFFVSSGDDRSIWLHRIKKNGEPCVSSASSTQNWPLSSYCSDRTKNAEAKRHNAVNAQIEVIDGMNTYYVAEHFRSKASEAAERAENAVRRGEAEEWIQRYRDEETRNRAVADRLSANAEQPKAKEPEIGIKFYWNGIKVDGGRLIPCYYSLYDDKVNIVAKDYKDLPTKYFVVENGTDIITDYFENDSTTLTPEHPLYRFARYAALKGLMNGRTWRTPTDELKAEWERTKDPGQPTAADLQAVEDLKTAKESARIAAEHAEELARREERLRKISEGRQFIEQTAAEYPVTDGAPTVEILFSENPAFYSWTESRDRTRTEIKIHADGTREEKTVIEEPRRRLILSVAAAEIVLQHFDEQVHAEQRGYDKTDFLIRWTDEKTGEAQTYEGRYDLGDNDGGLIEHIRAFGRSTLHDAEQNSEIQAFADYLEQYTSGGRVVNVELSPIVIDFLTYRKKKQEEAAQQNRRDWERIFAEVAMLTDEQLEAAVFQVDPKDEEKLDVARFFLQELNRRDENRAFEVFKRWQSGA